MSGKDPHMISGTWNWFGLLESSMVSPLVKSILRNGLCGVVEVPLWKLWSLLRCLEAFGISVTTACCESKTYSQPLLFKPSCHIYSHTCSVATISLLGLACITLDGMGEWNQQDEGEESLDGLSNSQACGSCTTLS
jgi:hypothetical protein